MNSSEKLKLVVLPGLDGTGKLFAPFVANLPPSIEPVVIQYPMNNYFTLNEYANFVESQLPPGKFALLAESFSGLVALQLLPKISSRLTCLVFANTFAKSPIPYVLRLFSYMPFLGFFSSFLPIWAIRAFCLGGQASKENCVWLRSVLKEVPSKIISSRLRIISQTKFVDRYEIQCSSFYIQASSDRLIPQKASKWFEKNIIGLKVLPLDTPHFMLQAKPKESAELIFKRLLSKDQ